MKTIFRTVKTSKYTQISNAMLRDKRLSLKARGLLAMILTNSDSWVVTRSWLMGVLSESRDSIRSALEELQAAGYAKYEGQEKDADGHFAKSVWTFFEESTVDGFPVDRLPVDGKPAPKKTISKKEDHREEEDMSGRPDEAGFQGMEPASQADENAFNLEASPSAEPTPKTPLLRQPPLSPPDQKKEAAKKRAEDAVKILLLLNELTGSNFRDVDSNIDLISARLAEKGVDAAGVEMMVRRQVAKWKPDPEMVDYLRPSTLFGKQKFDSYYAARDRPVIAPKTAAQTQTPYQLRSRLDLLEEAYLRHPANSNSVRFNPDASDEVKADAATKRAEIKSVKQQLAQLQQQQ